MEFIDLTSDSPPEHDPGALGVSISTSAVKRRKLDVGEVIELGDSHEEDFVEILASNQKWVESPKDVDGVVIITEPEQVHPSSSSSSMYASASSSSSRFLLEV